MSISSIRKGPDWGHVALVVFFAAITIAYLSDAYFASPKFKNLVLVLPASILSLCLCVLVGISEWRGHPAAAAEADAGFDDDRRTLLDRFRPAALMLLFAVYTLTLPWMGFDVGSALFVAAALLLDGERRIVLILGISTIFAALATLTFKSLLPFPMPLLVF